MSESLLGNIATNRGLPDVLCFVHLWLVLVLLLAAPKPHTQGNEENQHGNTANGPSDDSTRVLAPTRRGVAGSTGRGGGVLVARGPASAAASRAAACHRSQRRSRAKRDGDGVVFDGRLSSGRERDVGGETRGRSAAVLEVAALVGVLVADVAGTAGKDVGVDDAVCRTVAVDAARVNARSTVTLVGTASDGVVLRVDDAVRAV